MELLRMSKFMQSVIAKFGDAIFDNRDVLDVISTGSISLDISTGIGGIPRGRFTEIFGPESSGKTTLMLSVSKEAIKKGLKVLYIEPENTLSRSRIEGIIPNYTDENFVLIQPNTGEDTITIAEMGISSKEFGLIIVDSVGALAPEKEKDDELTDANVGLLARLLSKFFRRNAYNVRDNNVAFVFVNQVRAKIGTYTKGYETPGGNALKHYTSMRIQLYKGSQIKHGDSVVGIVSKYVVTKNKLAPPYRSYELPIMFTGGVDYLRDLIEFATMIGVIHKGGPYYKFGDETIGQGVVKTLETLENNKELLDKIIEECYNIGNGKSSNGDGEE